MAGGAIVITHNAAEFSDNIFEIAERFGSAKPAMEIIGETGVVSVQRNFEKGGRPTGWEPLAEATRARKKGGSTLVGKGHAGGLLGSIHYEAEDNVVYIGTDKIYAAIHNFGGMAGRGNKVKITQREFMLLQEEDVSSINELLSEFILTGET